MKLEGISLKLVQRIELNARGHTKTLDNIVCKSQSGPVLPGAKEDRTLCMPLPNGMEQTSKGRMARCTYSMNVALKVPWSPDIILLQDVQVSK